MRGLYFEEFEPGQVFEHALTRTITEADNMWFSCLTLNPQPLHIDAHFAAGEEFGKPLVNSLFTLGLLIGMTVADTTLGTTVGNLGMTEVKFPNPVFHGDTLRVRTTVKSVRASKSRPQNGLVEFLHEGFNQDGKLVASCVRTGLMKRKPQEAV
ncbi:MAG: MaoC family dehydratase [Alphaproteobacteria bacterium]|nr:MaoC family dehydratase [Alphaproteobacteria bacterium]MDX5370121.1 MaoC family dehydratase [Alphaproteobacteria bacterium]MDX5464683.1 MaoC family dehydratase [Alphaproteobacteria bacterium]